MAFSGRRWGKCGASWRFEAKTLTWPARTGFSRRYRPAGSSSVKRNHLCHDEDFRLHINPNPRCAPLVGGTLSGSRTPGFLVRSESMQERESERKRTGAVVTRIKNPAKRRPRVRLWAQTHRSQKDRVPNSPQRRTRGETRKIKASTIN